jgi:hypothetical protein
MRRELTNLIKETFLISFMGISWGFHADAMMMLVLSNHLDRKGIFLTHLRPY